jgi:hypothetical protein
MKTALRRSRSTHGTDSSEPLETPETPAGARAVNRLLLVLVLVLGATVVGLGAWIVVDRPGGESDAQALWDKSLAAWSSYDRDAVESVYAPDAQLRTTGGTRGATFSGNKAIGAMVFFFELEGVKASRISDFASSGEFGVSLGRQTTPSGDAPQTVLDVVQIRGDKIVRQWSFWLGQGVFDNVATKTP